MTNQWMIVLICFIVVGLSSYVESRFTTRIYQSSVLVQVELPSGNNQADVNSLLASSQLAQTEAALAVSDDILRQVVAHRKDITIDTLTHEATASVKLNTQIFEIDVQDANPQRAADLANDVAQTLINQQLAKVQHNGNIAIQQVQQEMQSIKQQINDIMGQIASLQAKGGQQAATNSLQGLLGILQQHYNEREDTLVQLEQTNAQSSNSLHIVQIARPELTPIRPNVLLNTTAGLVLGLLLGMLVAMLYETLRTHVSSSKDAAALVGYPLLATIWKARTPQEENVLHMTSQHVNVKAYRMLSTNIEIAGLDKQVNTIMVTSSLSKEGKSTVAANLAVCMANAGKNTILVDADLHCPVLHKRFGLPEEKKGLSDAAANLSQRQFMNVLSPTQQMQPSPATASTFSLEPYMHSVGVTNLRVMPAGSVLAGPSVMLDSKKVEGILAAIKNSGADVVIFDTAPLLEVPDTRVLATRVDTALVVIDITSARKKYLEQIKTLLENMRIQVSGCVVNKQVYKQKGATDYYFTSNLRNPMPQGNDAATPVPASSVLSSQRQRIYSDFV